MQKIVMLVAAAFVLIGAGVVLWYQSKPVDTDVEIGACPMDALMCPDGSAVGRSGDSCTFAPCPYTGPYVGTLMRQGEQFILSVAAPEGIRLEDVTYALPLTLRISNALAGLMGTQVRASGAFTEGNVLAVDTLEPFEPAGESGMGAQATAGVGETVFAGGVRITLHEVVADYRCPVDVQCMQGGAITAHVTLESDTDMETFNMPSDEAPRPFDAFQVSIVDVAPELISTQTIDPSTYQVTFVVEPLSENR